MINGVLQQRKHTEQQNAKQNNDHTCSGTIKPGIKDQNLGGSK